MTGGEPPHVAIRGLRKVFGSTVVLNGVDLDIMPGTIHALVGENGAGKSTLGRILAGAQTRDSGTITVDGRPVHYRTPRGGLENGISLVHQEISLVPTLTAAENVFLGQEPRTWGFVRRRSLDRALRDLEEDSGLRVPHAEPVSAMTLADQQKVELLRALARGARFIVLDEPTAALGLRETTLLLEFLRTLRDRGTTILFVSHFLDEVLQLSDFVSILRDGNHVRTAATRDENAGSLIAGMLGRPLGEAYPPLPPVESDVDVVLQVSGICRGAAPVNCDLSVRSGEIVGVAGLAGSGRTELARAIFGADPPERGRVLVNGQLLRLGSIASAMAHGVAFVPENRRDHGLVPMRSTAENITLASLQSLSRMGVLAPKREKAVVEGAFARADIRPREPTLAISRLSGGNQQKAIVARWIARDPAVLIVDEPTRGVDVGSRYALYQLICEAARQGCAVLMISSDLDEVVRMSHRVLVMRNGGICADLRSPTHQEILTLAFDHDPAEMS